MERLRTWTLAVVALLACCVLSACDDDEKLDINEVIEGTWVLDTNFGNGRGYEIVSDQTYDLLVDHIEFKAGKQFEFVVDEFETHTGTYEAGEAFLRFDYDAASGQESLLWQLLSFTEQTLKAKYYESEHDITVTVWLKKK